MIITGTSLKAFASICVGKLTNFSASYWHQLLSMFDVETKLNS